MNGEQATHEPAPSGEEPRRVVKRYSAQDRHELIKEYEASGETRKAFCAQRGLNLTTFHGWFKLQRKNAAKTKFAEVQVPAGSFSGDIEIVLGNGVTVRLQRGTDPGQTALLVRAIAGCRGEEA